MCSQRTYSLCYSHTSLFFTIILVSFTIISCTKGSEIPPIISGLDHSTRCTPNTVPLFEPTEVSSENGLLETNLVVDVARYPGVFSFTTRLYNGSFPGPTIRVKPGDIVRVRVFNVLGPEEHNSTYDTDILHSPNTTALHVHGVHVSPQGSADFIFDGIRPGRSHLYEYEIPEDHYPGSHWYHAHYHGSLALQVMGGMAGALIVDPPDNWLPAEFENIVWHVIVLQSLRYDEEIGSYIALAEQMGDAVDADFDICDTVDGSAVYVVNGLYQPYVTMEAGEYRVLQLIHASGDVYALEVVWSDPEVCEMWTMGKDGVYYDKPVKEHMAWLWAANRVDILIMCKEPGNFSLLANSSDPGTYWFYPVEQVATVVSQTLIHFRVTPDTESRADVDYEEISLPPKPHYLADLVDIDESEIRGRYSLTADFEKLTINGESFAGAQNYSFFMDVNQIYEFYIFSSNYTHPMHLHVNHFQIVKVDVYGMPGEYNQPFMYEHSNFLWNIGEWKDTLPAVAGYKITIRFRTDRWWGPVLYHCHYLQHADKGMLMVMFINPPETQPALPAFNSSETPPFDLYSEEQSTNIETSEESEDDEQS